MNFSSGERRGTVLLLVIVGIAILGMWLWRTKDVPDVRQLQPGSITTTDTTVETLPQPRDTIGHNLHKKQNKRNSGRRKSAKKNSEQKSSGNRRDFLNEPAR